MAIMADGEICAPEELPPEAPAALSTDPPALTEPALLSVVPVSVAKGNGLVVVEAMSKSACGAIDVCLVASLVGG